MSTRPGLFSLLVTSRRPLFASWVSISTLAAMTRRHARGHRGFFVVVVGPDGVGKTSVASALIEMWDGPTAYFHFRPPMKGPLDVRPMSGPPPGDKWPSGRTTVLAGWLRLARNTFLVVRGYLATVRPALRSGHLVVADRYVYGYQVQPRALRFRGPSALAAIASRLVPQPDLVVNLAAPPEVVHARKAELSPAEIRAELEAWSRVGGRRAETFLALDRPEEIAARVFSRLVDSARGVRN